MSTNEDNINEASKAEIPTPGEYLVLYHADCLANIASAWVAHNALNGHITTVPVAYDDPPFVPDTTYDAIYVVDFSYPIDHLCLLATMTNKLVVYVDV